MMSDWRDFPLVSVSGGGSASSDDAEVAVAGLGSPDEAAALGGAPLAPPGCGASGGG